MQDKIATGYLDSDGHAIFVASEIGGKEFGSFKRRASGSLKRVVSKALPMRATADAAQRDLDKWAKSHKLQPTEVTP